MLLKTRKYCPPPTELSCLNKISTLEQKGMTFDHDFVYSFPLFSYLLKKEVRRKGE